MADGQDDAVPIDDTPGTADSPRGLSDEPGNETDAGNAAPTAAQQTPSEDDRPGLRARRWGSVVLGIGVLLLAARILTVEVGILYGTTAVSQVDWVIGVFLASGAGLLVVGKTAQAKKAVEDRRAGQRWTDSLATATGLAATITVVVTVVNLLQPATPPDVSVSPCAGAAVRQSGERYVGVTAGPEGNNSRSGPASAFPPNGRFVKGCTIGFSFYCIGQPVLDTTGSTKEVTWYTSRWLVVARQSGWLPSLLARSLSHEVGEDRYVSDAYVTPQTRYDRLDYGREACQDHSRYPTPGRATLQPVTDEGILTAAAPHAVNMGFAMWVPGGAGFTDVAEYRQIHVEGIKPDGKPATPADNPGATDNTGSKSVLWLYGTVANELTATRGTVAVMAVPCLADNIPADSGAAAVTGYEISRAGTPRPAAQPSGFNRDQLARTACSANT